jgi:DNA-directed RNA polymerase specialized sigma24 family protein
MVPRRVLTDSPFDTLEKTFDLLVTGPNPLALDGTWLDGLPDRAIPLGELKAMLLHPSMAFAARDAVVDELVARSRAKGGAWTVGLAGVLLPGLRRAVWPLVQSCPGKAADIEAETLAAFLAAVARCEPGRARLASRLCWLARIGADRLMRAEVAERARPGTDPVSAAPPRPWGHPDLVLGRAVWAGVIGASDAELIGATRIGDVELAEVAKALGISYKACHQRRRRAESALVEWLTSDNYGDIAFDATNRRSRSRQSVPEQGRRGRPRQGERVVGQRV